MSTVNKHLVNSVPYCEVVIPCVKKYVTRVVFCSIFSDF